MKPKTLIVLIENYVSGGANKYAEDIVNSVEDCFGHIEIWGNTEAISSFNKTRLPSRVAFRKIKIFNQAEIIKNHTRPARLFLRVLLFPLMIFINLLSFIQIRSALKNKVNAQVLLCNGGYPASLFLIFSLLFIKKNNSPSMTIVSTPARKENIILNIFWKLTDFIVKKKIKILIVNSSAIKNELIAKCSFKSDFIQIVRNGIADQKIEKSKSKEIITIGFISRVENTKGIQELLAAYNKLRQKYSNIELLIAGGGSKENEVIAASNSDTSIHYLGHVTPGQINSIFAKIEIFVLPSYQEGLPYSVIEACMSSCAIVATDVGGIPEIIHHKKNGLLIPAKDEHALFSALECLIINPHLRLEYAANARSKYLQEFSLEKMKEKARVICP